MIPLWKTVDAGQLSYLHIYNSIYKMHGDNVAVIFEKNKETKKITYNEYDLLVRSTATKLKKALQSIPEQSFVAFRHDTDPYWFSVYWALLMAGYNVLLCDFKVESAIVTHLMAEADAKAIIVAKDDDVETSLLKINYEDLIEGNAEPLNSETAIWGKYFALCTSGTTATAKIYVYDSTSLAYQARKSKGLSDAFPELLNKETGVFFAMLPLHHIFGFVLTLFGAVFGNPVVFPSERIPSVLLNFCRKYKVNFIPSVPLFWNNIAKGILNKVKNDPEMEKKLKKGQKISFFLQKHFNMFGSKLARRFIFKKVHANLLGENFFLGISGGGHIPHETLNLFNGLGICLMNGYGSTESGISACCLERNVEPRLTGSIGRAVPGSELALIKGYQDPTAESIVKQGQGELIIRGKDLHMGKMLQGKIIAPDRYQENWFRSGDLARMDATGTIWLDGRLKDVIINESGENLYPDEIEEFYEKVPYCVSICVLGILNEKKNDSTVLVLHVDFDLKDAHKLAELKQKLSEATANVPRAKMPEKIFISTEPMPMANGFKVKRQKLRQLIQDGQYKYIENK